MMRPVRDVGSGHVSRLIGNDRSLAFIGSASAHVDRVSAHGDAEALSITRLEGSRWRGGRLWSWNRDPRACTVVDDGAVGARAAAARAPFVERTGTAPDQTGWDHASRHTFPDTCVTTLTQPAVRTWLDVHEVSKPRVTMARWSPERIGPMTIGAPHCGQRHAGGVEDICAAGAARRSRRRASPSRAVRQALAR